MKQLLLLLAIFCFAACGSDGTDSPDNPAPKPKDPIVIPDQPDLKPFTEQGGSATYRFTAKADWTADVAETRAVEWCRVSPTSGGQGEVTLSISADPNDTADERNATIKLQAGSFSKAFSISQKQQNALTVTSSKIEVAAEGRQVIVEVKANISFEYQIEADAADWISYVGTRALQTSRLEFKVAENDDTALREGTITIRSSEGSETVKIYQSGAASVLVLTQKDYTVAAEGATIKVEIKSNVDYDVTMPTANWITEVGTRAMSTHTRYYAIAPNEEYDARSAEIVFTNKANNLTQKVTVAQMQENALVVAQNSYTVTNAGGEIKIAVNHNVDFDVAIGADWVTQVGTRALTTDNLTFKVAAHTGYDNREAKITFTSKDKAITQEVKVYQAQKNAIIVSKREYTLDETAGQIEIEVRANIEFTVEGPGVDWLHKVETRALTTHTLRYTVDANTDYDPRTATIKITNKDNNISETVTVTQVQKNALVVAKTEYEFGAEGGKLEIHTRTSNPAAVEITISEDARSWLKNGWHETRDIVPISFGFTIVSCDANVTRTGTITFKLADITQKVTIKQSSDLSKKERQALIALYNATGGDNWLRKDNWCSDKPLSEWYGVLVTNGRVSHLNFVNNNMKGYIPEEIGELTDLWNLGIRTSAELVDGELVPSLTPNILQGNIPASIGKLAGLDGLDLCGNELSGTIPESMWNLTNLYSLNLSGNKLTVGALSDKIGNLTYLHHLYLNHCQISELPNSLGNLPHLNFVDLGNNKISTIPSNFANLMNARAEGVGDKAENHNFIDVAWNNLTGMLPNEILNHKDFAHYMGYFMAWQNEGYGLDWNSMRTPAVSRSYPSLNGGSVILADEYPKNEYTLLLRWAEWCPTSKAIIPVVMDLYEQYKSSGFNVIGAYSGGNQADRDRYMQSSGIGVWKHFVENDHQETIFINAVNPIFSCWMGYGTPFGVLVNKRGDVVRFIDVGQFILYDPKIAIYSRSFNDLSSFLSAHLVDPDKPYESTDYSADGQVTKLQQATRGNGINIVLMGDAYSDRLIADGTYEQTMRKAMDYFFTEEPYKSYRDCFNVYSVNVVSKNEKYGTGMQTALEGYFGGGTRVGGNDNKCIEYATRVPGISDSNLGSTLVVVMMNRKYYAGTCYMYSPNSGDYSQGVSISYFPFLDDDGFKQVLHHEAGGHGFPKLADEYAYQNMGAIPQSEIDGTKQLEPYGWWKNVDFTSDVTRIKWSKFIADPRYAAEALGAYQGGLTFWSGVWRPTNNSIMRYNTGCFNAPSREAIYYRIHKLAYGASWTYNYEDFVRYDAVNRTGDVPRMLRAPMAEPKNFVPLHPPVVIRK